MKLHILIHYNWNYQKTNLVQIIATKAKEEGNAQRYRVNYKQSSICICKINYIDVDCSVEAGFLILG